MKNKKIIIICSIVLIIAIYIFVLIKMVNQKNVEILTSDSSFFTIQNTINTFLNEKDANKLLSMLEDNYILENNITVNNVFQSNKFNYDNASFIAKKILYYRDNSIFYYFVNGYIIDIKYDRKYNYEKNKNYLVVVQNSKYVIVPLQDNIDINEFAKKNNYNVNKVDKGLNLVNTPTNEKNKLVTYLAEFKNLLYLDSYQAYDLLGNNTKKKYRTYDDFYNNIDNINNNIDTIIDNYTKTMENSNRIYYINNSSIVIIESNIMDYKIDF